MDFYSSNDFCDQFNSCYPLWLSFYKKNHSEYTKFPYFIDQSSVQLGKSVQAYLQNFMMISHFYYRVTI